jgi:hypothetical protein
MIRGVAASLFVLCVGPCHAGILRCSFTEPFFVLEFDSSTHKVVRVAAADDVGNKPVTTVISRNARLERTIGEKEFETFELTDGRAIILTLRLDARGSDGMSEKVFPFRATVGHHEGACDTRKYPAWDFDALTDDLDVR